jgi:Rod binding domain-containing protein
MSVASISPTTSSTVPLERFAAQPATPVEQARRVRDVFQEFVGETFYRQMLKSMRESVGKPAYFHGGRGEEVFTNQFDQVLSESLSKANGSEFSNGMFAHAFPHLAAVLKEADSDASASATSADLPDPFNELASLPRR